MCSETSSTYIKLFTFAFSLVKIEIAINLYIVCFFDFCQIYYILQEEKEIPIELNGRI